MPKEIVGNTIGKITMFSLMSNLISEIDATWVEFNIKMIDEEDLWRRDKKKDLEKMLSYVKLQLALDLNQLEVDKIIWLFNHNLSG